MWDHSSPTRDDQGLNSHPLHWKVSLNHQMTREVPEILIVSSSSSSSVTQLCLTLFDPMNCSTPGLPVHHQLPEFTQSHFHQVGDAIQPSHPLLSLFLLIQSFPASESFQVSKFFVSRGQSIGVSASILVLPMNTQD